MRGSVYTMIPPIVWRTELFPGGAYRRVKRRSANTCPVGVFKAKDALAYMYTCPVTGHYVVAARGDTRKIGSRHFVCYQSFPERAAAVMYAQLRGR